MGTRLILSGLLLFFTMSVLAQKKKKDENPQLASGKKVYASLCIACHQEDGSGVPSLNPPLMKSDWVSGDKNRLINIVLKGLQDKIEVNGESYEAVMPANDYLSDKEIADVLTYVRNSFGNKATAITSAEVKAVRDKK